MKLHELEQSFTIEAHAIPLALLILYCVLSKIPRELCEKPQIAIAGYVPCIISVSCTAAVPRETTWRKIVT